VTGVYEHRDDGQRAEDLVGSVDSDDQAAVVDYGPAVPRLARVRAAHQQVDQLREERDGVPGTGQRAAGTVELPMWQGQQQVG